MKDLWISFVQLADTWCQVLPDGHVAKDGDVFSLPEGVIIGEYDLDSCTVMIFKDCFGLLSARVEFSRSLVESANIVAIGYAPDLCLLDVEFFGGAVYRYFNVPPSVYLALMAADSHGKYLAKGVKGKFDHIKLDA